MSLLHDFESFYSGKNYMGICTCPPIKGKLRNPVVYCFPVYLCESAFGDFWKLEFPLSQRFIIVKPPFSPRLNACLNCFGCITNSALDLQIFGEEK